MLYTRYATGVSCHLVNRKRSGNSFFCEFDVSRRGQVGHRVPLLFFHAALKKRKSRRHCPFHVHAYLKGKVILILTKQLCSMCDFLISFQNSCRRLCLNSPTLSKFVCCGTGRGPPGCDTLVTVTQLYVNIIRTYVRAKWGRRAKKIVR